MQALGIALTERLKVRRRVAAAAGKKDSTLLTVFLAVNRLQEQELDRKVAEGGRSVEKADFEEVQRRGQEQVVHLQTRYLGVTWPQRHNLMFDEETIVDVWEVCLQDVKKMQGVGGEA